MRRWNGRPQTPAQFDVTRIRAIGEWGHASRYIGGRWEELGLTKLQDSLNDRGSGLLLPICADADLQGSLAATGSKNPDTVIISLSDEGLDLRPADLKWSLDVATFRQVSASVLDNLLEQVPLLVESVRALLPSEALELPWKARDGVFVCPDTYANRRFIESEDNKRQEFPIGPTDVQYEKVDSYDFFEPLPGWNTARELARLDGSTRGLGQIDTADRYYHLGAGVAGAILAVERSIFDDDDIFDQTADDVDRFRSFLRTLTPPSTAVIIDRLGALMRHRRDLVRRLREITRASFTFGDFAGELIDADLASEDAPEASLRRPWNDAYHSFVDDVEAEIREAGRDLIANGMTDGQALEELEQQRDVFARQLRLRAQLLIRRLRETSVVGQPDTELAP